MDYDVFFNSMWLNLHSSIYKISIPNFLLDIFDLFDFNRLIFRLFLFSPDKFSSNNFPQREIYYMRNNVFIDSFGKKLRYAFKIYLLNH
jgi:hypothetical protein